MDKKFLALLSILGLFAVLVVGVLVYRAHEADLYFVENPSLELQN